MSAELTPTDAPQAQASFVIAGCATDRMMCAIGAWYSARPIAWWIASASEAEQPCGGSGGAEAAPRAAGVVAVVARVERDAGADRDLVAHDDGEQELLGGRVRELGGGERRGDDDRARMPLREAVAVVVVEDVGEDAVAPRGADRAEAAAVEQRRGLVAGVDRRRVGGRQLRRRRRPPGDADRREVGQQQPHVLAHGGRDVGPAQVADELDLRGGAHARRPPARRSDGVASAAPRSAAAASTAAQRSSSWPSTRNDGAETLRAPTIAPPASRTGAAAATRPPSNSSLARTTPRSRPCAIRACSAATSVGRVARAARELDVGEEQLERRRVVVEEQRLARGGAVGRGDPPDPADGLDGAAGRLGEQRQDLGALQDGEVRALLRLDGEAPQPRAPPPRAGAARPRAGRARRSASRAGT